jgi:hypothetical protein
VSYLLELRWDGVQSVSVALQMLREQAERTPAGQWVRVGGGWSGAQFAEKRLPTVSELNAATLETPVLVLHLYQSAILKRAAIAALGYTKDTPEPVRCQNPAQWADLLLYARHLCSLASSISSWSGCWAGWWFWPGMTQARSFGKQIAPTSRRGSTDLRPPANLKLQASAAEVRARPAASSPPGLTRKPRHTKGGAR